MPDNVSVGPTGSAWARSNCSGREEVAGGELLEEGGAGALTGLCPGLECLPNRLWQSGLERGQVKKENRENNSKKQLIYIDTYMLFSPVICIFRPMLKIIPKSN